MISSQIDLLADMAEDSYIYSLSGLVMDREGAELFLAFLRDIRGGQGPHIRGIDTWIENLEETLGL